MQALPATQDPSASLTLDVGGVRLTDDQFHRLCADNPDLRFELTADARLIVMPPTFTGTGWKESEFNYRLARWADEDGTGLTFGSSTGFTLANGAKRSPDASWVLRERWESLGWQQQNREFAPLCPDFVAEIRSASDSVPAVEAKMLEYLAQGARLGWLLDPIDRRVVIYRDGREPESLKNPGILDGENVLPGFRFDFSTILEPPEPAAGGD